MVVTTYCISNAAWFVLNVGFIYYDNHGSSHNRDNKLIICACYRIMMPQNLTIAHPQLPA